jgi:deoxyribodipyrimidine photo-lyase
MYWMTMFRRRGWNFALQRAADWARALDRPLVILEALRCGYPWASDRIHAFMLEGMACNQLQFASGGALYYPYVEPKIDAGKGLLAALAARACVVVGDDFPCFMLPRMVAAAARRMPVRFEVVDSNGLLPMRAAEKAYASAFDFRRFLQRALPAHLTCLPLTDALDGAPLKPLGQLPDDVLSRWPPATEQALAVHPDALAALPIDHAVAPAALRGGVDVATERLETFVSRGLRHYAERRGDPDADATSRFSPYLHFGHLSVHQILGRIAKKERWRVGRLSGTAGGQREGWWGMSPPTEAFLDELVTWRELSFNACVQRPDDYDRYESLPEWALKTLSEHENDTRPHLYSLRELEAGRTHDQVWNAAQAQLVGEGWFHNRMRMLWAKKILEWSPRPRDALDAMAQLMNKYSLDGRNPNSYSGYMWTLGRYDRPWMERPIFGKVRYMSSDATSRKARLQEYVKRFAPDEVRA